MVEPISSEEQKDALGKIEKKPMQRDLFTGELVLKPPKIGRGDHIKLKSFPGEKPRVPGMASWAGDGPKDKYCYQCHHYGTVSVMNQRGDKTECLSGACAQYAKRTGKLPMVQVDIAFSPACNVFQDGDGEPRTWLLDNAGKLTRGVVEIKDDDAAG